MRNKIPYLFFSLISVLLFISCNNTSQNFIKDISFYQDEFKNLTIEDVSQKNFKDLKKNSLGSNNGNYWFKLKLEQKALNEKIIIQLKEAYLKELIIYNSQLEKIQRFNDYENATFYINLEAHKPIFYFKVKFDRNPYLIINSFSEKNLANVKKSEAFKSTGYYIFVILVLIINLILAYFFKNTIFLWYVFFAASINVLIALYDNTLTGFITNTKALNTFIGIVYLIVPLSTTIFCVKLLKVNLFYPKLTHFLKLLFVPVIILNISFHITHNFEILAYQDLFSSIFYIITLTLGFLLIRKSMYAKYYVIGYSILFTVGILYSIIINFGLTYIPVSMNILKLGVIAEITLLTFAAILKAKEVFRENEKIKQELVLQSKNIDFLKQKNQNKKISDEKLDFISKKYQFTKREKEVFPMILKGNNNQQIADELFISINTVKYHSKNIYEKLHVKSRLELTALFVKKDL
ncbi:LuxR C-terminal-related transcriptional regulator [Polaribacter porphyrae]|uniref:HTH luxR-type domain-containing protein n=1 Tax=Polaribacter porphyrae TaxID=1137780 RepID=A0A2S7WTE5_9FLAO|nr:LuxR C-terminal-related transcriptional regulator [Polaribacter porphyrae]PQJ80736.1 hypothetical protein BTO18_16850 [Polaribacter porphyrae]